MKKQAALALAVGLMISMSACEKKEPPADGVEGSPAVTAEAVIDQAVYDRCFSEGLETIEGVPEAERNDAIDEFDRECREEALLKK